MASLCNKNKSPLSQFLRYEASFPGVHKRVLVNNREMSANTAWMRHLWLICFWPRDLKLARAFSRAHLTDEWQLG